MFSFHDSRSRSGRFLVSNLSPGSVNHLGACHAFPVENTMLGVSHLGGEAYELYMVRMS